MKLGLTDNQYKNLLTLLQEQAEAPAAEPEKGTSDKQAGGQGYPAVGKWESGVTRGPGNQVGVTKWADVVGAKLNRGKANPLKEQLSTGVSSGTYNPTNQYTSSDGQTITPSPYFPKIQKQSTQQPVKSTLTSQEKYKLSKVTNEITKDQYGNDYFTDGKPMTYPHYTNNGKTFLSDGGAIRWRNVDVKEYTPEFWKGKEKPIEPFIAQDNPKSNDKLKGLVWDKLAGDYVVPSISDSNKNTGYKRPGDKDYVWRNPAVNNKFYRTDLNDWYLGNLGVTLQQMENFVNRKTDSGVDVPKGFNPKTYPEYLSKQSAIQNQIDGIESKHKMGYWSQKELNQVNNLKQQLVNLKNQHQNPNFSYGLNSKESEQYERMKKELDDLYLPLINGYQKEIKKKEDERVKKYGTIRQPMGQDATRNVASEKLDNKKMGCELYLIGTPERKLCELQTDYTDRRTKLDFSFGKDDWSKDIGMFGQDFDEWWDKWGGLVQLGGNILFVALSGGIITVIRGGLAVAGESIAVNLAAKGTLEAVSPYVLDSIFNASVGAYQISRKQDAEALTSLVCALVPFVSFGANIGKVSIETSKKLALKVAKADFSTQSNIISFASTLTDEERFVFRNVYNLPRQAIKDGLDKIIKNKALKIAQIGYDVAKPAKKIWIKSLSKITSLELGLPLSVSIGNSIFNVFKDKTITNFSAEELAQIKLSIKELTETEPPVNVFTTGNEIVENIGTFKSMEDVVNYIGKTKGRQATDAENEEFNKFRKEHGMKTVDTKKYKK